MYCVVDSELPDITTGCDLIGAGAYGCQGSRTGEPCDRATQLYLYEYQLGDSDRYYKILHYYVCDVDGRWYEGS